MDLVLVGLPGGGKSAAGRRLARLHGAEVVDLDEVIAAGAGRPIAAIFDEEGEAGFRDRERAAVATLGPADAEPGLRRVISTGGGAPIDPRNRWLLYRGRHVAWLDAPAEVLAQRIRRSPSPRPLLAGRDPIGKMRELAAARARFYAPALRVNGIVGLAGVVKALERHVDDPIAEGTTLLRAQTAIGRYELGEGNAVAGVLAALAALEARRAILVSEPRAWEVAGSALADGLAAAGVPVDHILLPEGEAAKQMAVVEGAARELARLRAERSDPLIAIGGGALGDAAGFLAATWLRGVPVIHVPTTLVAQIDSAIGGKTAVDLPEGKNLVGAFHQPAAVVVDVRFLRTLPARQLRAALGEAVKMAALGDERLFELLEAEGPAIAAGEARVHANGALAEVVERCGWAKIEVVTADEREQGARIHLNLGHTLGHAIEAAARYEGILHGEAVAYGLRAVCRIGVAVEVTPPERATRVEALLDALDLGRAPLPYPLHEVLAAMVTDKKHAGGRLRWVLPTAAGVTVRSDVPDETVEAAARGVLAAADAGAPG
ncbi:MAG TPA: bifunctional shikimate kinase/3-dehydroquinate synthase [Patescibacteria group bacterium]|nr:bifunctional shikimate kinase/3-dehydroquinate synthase [Patescibacteria group bacterium]